MARSRPRNALFLALLLGLAACGTTYRPTDDIPDGCEVEAELRGPTKLTCTRASGDVHEETDVTSLKGRVTSSSAENLEFVLHEVRRRNRDSRAVEGYQLVLPRAGVAKLTKTSPNSRSFEDRLGEFLAGVATIALLVVFPLWIAIAGS